MNNLVVGRGISSENSPKLGIIHFDQAKVFSDVGHEITYLGIDIRLLRRWRKWGIISKAINDIKCYGFNFAGGKD